jgi:predicted nucleotide-binding protein
MAFTYQLATSQEPCGSDGVFISHGRSNEWFKVQSYLEKDLNVKTLELAQEASQGRTVLQKLNEESQKCRFAVIVMTGDDITGDQVRARENVMHEIGFFQGKYGLKNIALLHEEGVNIPSNIHGLVYIPFPKNTVEATFGALYREIKVANAQ